MVGVSRAPAPASGGRGGIQGCVVAAAAPEMGQLFLFGACKRWTCGVSVFLSHFASPRLIS